MSPGPGPAIRGSRSRSWTRNSRVSVRQLQGSRPMLSRAACWATSSPARSTRRAHTIPQEEHWKLAPFRNHSTIPQRCDTPRVPLVGGLRPHHGEPQNSHDGPLFFPQKRIISPKCSRRKAYGVKPRVLELDRWSERIAHHAED